jgi:parallel beta-helix repeat protein
MRKSIKFVPGVMVVVIVLSLLLPTTAFAQDTVPADPTNEPVDILTEVIVLTETPTATPADVVIETTEVAPVTVEDPGTTTEPGLFDVVVAVVETAAAVSGGDPSGVLGASAYGAPAGSPFSYFPADGTHPNGTCDYGATTPGTLTCYWTAPIQNAVTDAAVGSTVTVAAGDYTEDVDITKNLTLQAIGAVTLHSPTLLTSDFSTPAENRPIIFVTGADNVTIDGFTINGDGKGNSNYRFIGIAYYNAGGTISNNTILGITDTPKSGAQHGVGIYVNNADGSVRTIEVTGNDISDYQKTGMAFIGDNLTANVTDNTVTGWGPTSITAQNGIQFADGVGGTIADNTVTGNYYTGPSWSASGLLVMNTDAPVLITGNTVTDNQANLYSYDSTNVTVSGNTFSGGDYGTIFSFSGNPGPVTGDFTENNFTGNTLGIYTDNPATLVNENNFYGNTDGVYFDDWWKIGGTMDATNNYWGCPGGAELNPANPSYPNPSGCEFVWGDVNVEPYASTLITDPVLQPTPENIGGDTGVRIIPVTGGVFTELGCAGPATLLLSDGTRAIFNQTLCNSSASLDLAKSDTLPLSLPSGSTFAAGATLLVQNAGANVDILPAGISVILAFPKPADLGTTFTVDYWDAKANNGAGAWVELPTGGPIVQGDSRVVVAGVSETNGFIQLNVNFTGTFILVSK